MNEDVNAADDDLHLTHLQSGSSAVFSPPPSTPTPSQQQQQQHHHKNKTVVKSGELFLSTVSAGERERWRSRFFTLYTDGELICGLSADPTVPILESIDLKQCISINMSDDTFCLGFSNRTCFFRAANQQETKRWFLLLSEFFNNGPAAMLQRANKRVRLLLPTSGPNAATPQHQRLGFVDPDTQQMCDNMTRSVQDGNRMYHVRNNNQPVENNNQNRPQSQTVTSPRRSDSFTTAVLGGGSNQQSNQQFQQPTIPESSFEPQDGSNWVKKLQLMVDRSQQNNSTVKNKQLSQNISSKNSAIRTVNVLKADWVMLKSPQQPPSQPQKNPLSASSWSRCWMELTTSNGSFYRLTAYRSSEDRGIVNERIFGRGTGEIRITTGKAGQLYTISIELVNNNKQPGLIFAALSQNVASDWLGAFEKCDSVSATIISTSNTNIFDPSSKPKSPNGQTPRKQVYEFLEQKPQPHYQKRQNFAADYPHNHKYYHYRDITNGFYGGPEGPSNLLLANSAHLSSSEPSLLDRLGTPVVSNMDHYFKQPSQSSIPGATTIVDVNSTPKCNAQKSPNNLIAGAERAAFQLLESEVNSLKTRLQLAAEEISKLTEANAALTKQMASLQRCQQESYSEIVKESQRYLEQIAEMHADMDSQSHFYEVQIQAANRNLKQANFRLKFVLDLVEILKGSTEQPSAEDISQKVVEIVHHYQESNCSGSRDSEDQQGGEWKAWFGQVGQKFQAIIAETLNAKTAASYEATVKRLENDNRTIRDEAATLSASVTELREMIREKLGECDELCAQNYRLQAELERTQDALSNEIRKNSSKQSKFSRLEGCVEEQRERIRAMENQAERSRFMVKKMEASLEARTHQITYLKRMVTHLNPAGGQLMVDSPDASNGGVKSPTASENSQITASQDQGFAGLFLKYCAAIEQLERLKNERSSNCSAQTVINDTSKQETEPQDQMLPPMPQVSQGNAPTTTPLVISTCLREMRTAIDRLQASNSSNKTIGEISSCLARLTSVVTEQAEAFEAIQAWCETVKRRQKSLEDSYQTRLGLLLERLSEQQVAGFESKRCATPPVEPPIQPQVAFETFNNKNKQTSEIPKLISWLQLMVLKEIRDDTSPPATEQEPDSAAKSERQRLLWQANRSLQMALPLLSRDNETDFRQFLTNLVVLIEGCGLLPPEATVTCALDSNTNGNNGNSATHGLDIFSSSGPAGKTTPAPPCRDAVLARLNGEDANCYSLAIAYLESTRESITPGLRSLLDALISHAKSQQESNAGHECSLSSLVTNHRNHKTDTGDRQQEQDTSTGIKAESTTPQQQVSNSKEVEQAESSSKPKMPPSGSNGSRKVILTNISLLRSRQNGNNNGQINSSSSNGSSGSSSSSNKSSCLLKSSSSERTLLGVTVKALKSSTNGSFKLKKPLPSNEPQIKSNNETIADDETVRSVTLKNAPLSASLTTAAATPARPVAQNNRQHPLSTSCEYLRTRTEVFDI